VTSVICLRLRPYVSVRISVQFWERWRWATGINWEAFGRRAPVRRDG